MPDPIPCPQCGRLFVWDGTRCCHKLCRFGSSKEPGSEPSAAVPALKPCWTKDSKHVYSYGSRIAKADVHTFIVLNPLFAKDANRCYYLGGSIKEADAASFQALDDGVCVTEFHNGFGDHVRTYRSTAGFAADEQRVYHHVGTIGKPCALKNADRASFEVLRCGFGRDKRSVFYEKWRLKGADPFSFQVIPPLWGKDKKSVYYCGTRLAGADPESFMILSSCDYLAKDSRHFYDQGLEVSQTHAFPHGSKIAGYPLASVKDVTIASDYLRRGATPHDRLALNAACQKGDINMVKLLLAAGCDPRITDAGQNSCLTEFYCENDLEIAKLLIKAGADANHMIQYCPAQHGKRINAGALHSPLEHALFRGRFELADYLISVGAEIHTTTGEGHSLIEYFRNVNNLPAVDFLAAKGAWRFPAGRA